MKPYQEVVRDRYDRREADQPPLDSQYALLNPVGFYASQRLHEAFRQAFQRLRALGWDVTALQILDAGCGSGALTRFLAELTGQPGNIAGLDLSTHRIEQARRLNPVIRYTCGDLLELDEPARYELITAVDVLMHLGAAEQVAAALGSLYRSLRPGGALFWLEPYAADHFTAPPGAEAHGFHPRQMAALAQAAGFAPWFSTPLFRWIINRHSVYLTRRLPFGLVRLLETVIPGPPGSTLFALRKPAE